MDYGSQYRFEPPTSLNTREALVREVESSFMQATALPVAVDVLRRACLSPVRTDYATPRVLSRAEAAVVRARADEVLTRLGVQSAGGVAFLAVVAAEQAVIALNSTARIDVWRALLAEVVAHGDLTSFASLVRAPGRGR